MDYKEPQPSWEKHLARIRKISNMQFDETSPESVNSSLVGPKVDAHGLHGHAIE